MSSSLSKFIVALVPFLALSAQAAPINQVPYGEVSGTGLITFTGLGSALPSTNYDGILSVSGVTFGERFAGQTRGTSADGDFDVLSGSPTGPLTVVAGQQNQNLVVLLDDDVQSEVLAGLGPLGFPNLDAVGEGAIAARFIKEQFGFGFQLVQGAGGRAFIGFFRSDGSLIDQLQIDLPTVGSRFYGFSREGGVADIAGFSMYNDDLGGIGLDNLKFTPDNGQPVPEPATLLLLGAGVAALALRRRR